MSIGMDDFWLYSMIALLLISRNSELSIFMKVALILNAVMVTIHLINDIKEYWNGRKEKKNHNLKRG